MVGCALAGPACGGHAKNEPAATGGSAAGGSLAGSAGSGPAAGTESGFGGKPPGSSGAFGFAASPSEQVGGQPPTKCNSGHSRCQGQDVLYCNADGSEELVASCSVHHDCRVVSLGRAACVLQACEPGGNVCVGNELQTCTEHGEPSGKGKDCGDDICDAGACKPKICEPGAKSCVEGEPENLYECMSGVEWLATKKCTAGELCANVGGVTACYPDSCHPGTRRCVAEVVGICADNAQGFGTIEKNCLEQGQVCDTAFECQDSVVDVTASDFGEPWGKAIDPPDRIFAGNGIQVETARLLTRVEIYLAFDMPGSLEWYVMPVDTEQTPIAVTAHQAGEGYFDSGPVSVPLSPGTTYLMGVAFLDHGDIFEDARALQSPPVSFGSVRGRAYALYDNFHYTDGGAARMRFTTQAP